MTVTTITVGYLGFSRAAQNAIVGSYHIHQRRPRDAELNRLSKSQLNILKMQIYLKAIQSIPYTVSLVCGTTWAYILKNLGQSDPPLFTTESDLAITCTMLDMFMVFNPIISVLDDKSTKKMSFLSILILY